jgi:hypothetical protein
MPDTNIANTARTSAQSGAASVRTSSSNHTPSQVLAGIKANMTPAKKVNSEPHRNTQTQKLDVNVYQVASGFFAYTSSMAIDTAPARPTLVPIRLSSRGAGGLILANAKSQSHATEPIPKPTAKVS